MASTKKKPNRYWAKRIQEQTKQAYEFGLRNGINQGIRQEAERLKADTEQKKLEQDRMKAKIEVLRAAAQNMDAFSHLLKEFMERP